MVSDILKKRSILGFFSGTNTIDLYSNIYRTRDIQDSVLDFLFTIYNSIIEHGIDVDRLFNSYNTQVEWLVGSGLTDTIKEQYIGKELVDTTLEGKEDSVIVTLYFIRLYLGYFDNVIVNIHNLHHLQKGQEDGTYI